MKFIQKYFLYTGITLLIIPCAAHADETLKKISVDEAVSIALSGNRDIIAMQKRVEQTSLRVDQVWGELMPTVESQASLVRQGAESGLSAMSDGSYDIRLIQVSLGLNPGVFYNSLKAASTEYAFSREELKRIRAKITGDTIRVYFNTVRTEELMKMRKDSYAQLKSNAADVENLFKNGSVSRFEYLQARSQLLNAEPLVKEAETLHLTAIDALNMTLGSDTVIYTATFDNAQMIASFPQHSSDNSMTDLLVQTALKNRPEVIELSLRKQQTESMQNMQRSLYIFPVFSIGGNYGYTKNLTHGVSIPQSNNLQQQAVSSALSSGLNSIFGNSSWQDNWQIRAAATYRWNGILPFDRIRTKQDEYRLQEEETDINASQLRRAISITVKKDFLMMKTAYLTLQSRKESIATAEEGLKTAKVGFKEGLLKNSDLLTAESLLTGARSAYIDALFNYYSSLADLQSETGAASLQSIFPKEIK